MVHSKTIVYEWLKGLRERRQRKVKLINEAVAASAMQVILKYPHLGGSKGQAYLIYHRLGYIPRHVYQSLKKVVGRVLFQQVCALNLLPRPSVYEHERPTAVNEIWAEDFTKVSVLGFNYPVAVVEDVFSTKYLGSCVQLRENSQLVGQPVEMAVKANNNAGPDKFLIADNGSQYTSDAHGRLLAKHEIVQKHIPVGKPQYNGTVECGMRDIKSVFYNVFSQNDLKEFAPVDMDVTDKRKKLLEKVALSVNESLRILNEELPRPAFGGITPNDIHAGIGAEKKMANVEYLKNEQIKENGCHWSKSKYDLAKEVLEQMHFSKKELLIKHCFFQKNAFRRIGNLPSDVWTN